MTGVLFLQVLTSLAVIVYFARNPRGEGLWHRFIAPALAAIALLVVLWLVCAKMDLLTGLDTRGNILINLPLVVAFIFGVVRAFVLQRSDPRAWESLGKGEMAKAVS